MADHKKPKRSLPTVIMSDKEAANIEQLESASGLDTAHNDDAVNILAAFDGDREWTAQEEEKVLRKIDFKLMIILCLTYGIQYYDKGLLSQAVSSAAKR